MAIFTLAGTAIAGALFAGSALAASVISAGLAVGAQLALSYFTRKKHPSEGQQEKRTAISGNIQFGADVPVWTVYGKSAVTGHRAYYGAWGTGDEYNGEVFILSNGHCDGLEPYVYFYGEKHTLTSVSTIGNETARYTVAGFSDLIDVRFYDGGAGQLADAKLVSDTSGLDNTWKSTSKLTGMAYVIVERKYDQDKFADGRPQFKWVLRGKKLYDWRKDSTVSGGSGDHRIDDPSTHEWSHNPFLSRADFEMGLKGLISGRSIIGMGKAFSELHLASYTTAANSADTERTKNARTFDTYQIGMIVDSETDFTEVLRDFDDAGAGYSFSASGLSGIIVGAPQIVAHTITVDDIRMDAQKTIRYRRPSTEAYNYLTGSFISQEAFWEAESLTPVTVSADVTADKRRRSLAYDFMQVSDPDVAQYLLNIRYRQNRKGGYATLPVSKHLAFKAEAGDWVTYAGLTWIIMGRRWSQGGFTLELAETGSDVYSETGIAVGPTAVAVTPTARASVAAIDGFSISEGLEQGDDGGGVPILIAQWDAITDPRVDASAVQYRRVGTTDAKTERVDQIGATSTTLRGVAGGVPYEARIAAIYDTNRLGPWSDWESVTTQVPAASPPADNSVNFSKWAADTQSILANLQSNIGDLQTVVAADATSGGLAHLERYNEDNRIRALVSNLGDASKALVVEETVARTSAIDAFASQALLVSAALGDAEATGLMKLESSISGDGLTTSFSFFARATTADDFAEAGMIIEVVSDGGDPATLTSRVAFAADKFVFDNGSQPFVITEDGVFLKDMFFERLRSSPSITAYEMDINALNGTLRIATAP